MPRLIINADDLGLTAGVNRAIVEAHRAGVVTAATLMANSRAFGDAVRLAHEAPELSVGCHVTLVDGEPLLAPKHIPTLIAGDGGFRRGLVGFARAASTGKIKDAEITAEATAQIRKLQAAGIAVTHLDTHKHAHMFPQVLKPLLRAARECGVPAIRNPYAPARPLPLGEIARRPGLWKRYFEVKLLRQLGAATFRRRVEAEGLITSDGTFGIVCTGALDVGLFKVIVSCMPEGTWELVCHPGYDDAELSAIRTRLRASRQRELELLTSREARVFLQERDIQLVSYRDLLNHQITTSPNHAML